MWIKLLKDYAGKKAGEKIDAEDGVARAYIAAKYAEEYKEAEGDLTRSLKAELQEGMAAPALWSGCPGQGNHQDHRHRVPVVQPADRSHRIRRREAGQRGGFKSLGHFATDVIRSGAKAPAMVADDSTRQIQPGCRPDQPCCQQPGRDGREHRPGRRCARSAGLQRPRSREGVYARTTR